MKIVSICDDKDICAGLRLAGIDGDIVYTAEEFCQIFKSAIADRQVAIVVVTKGVAQRHAGQLNEVRLGSALPLIVEI